MDAFKKFGIEHLSASALNAYQSEPAMWVLNYIYGFKSKSPAMLRGLAGEKALCDSMRQNAGVEACVHTAEFLFDADCEAAKFPLGHEDVVKERSAIRPLCESGYVGLIPLAEEGMEFQKRIDVDLGPDLPPLVGYIDIIGRHKLYELKTTLRMPSEPKRAHMRQAAIYAVHEEKVAEIVYIAPPVKSGNHHGFKVFPVTDPLGLMYEVKRIAVSMRRVLSAADGDRRALTEIVTPDFDKFHWSDPEMKKHAEEIWR